MRNSLEVRVRVSEQFGGRRRVCGTVWRYE